MKTLLFVLTNFVQVNNNDGNSWQQSSGQFDCDNMGIFALDLFSLKNYKHKYIWCSV